MKYGKKIVYTLIIIMLSGVLYAIWTKKINYQSFLAFLGILAVFFSVMKVFFPGIKFKIVSFYPTLDKNKRALFILKLQTISNVELMLDDVMINLTLENGKTLKMVPISFRWKGVFFKMPDINKQESVYKLLKPLEPDLRTCGIKRGMNECYITMKSAKVFEDKPIKSWTFPLIKLWSFPLIKSWAFPLIKS